MAITCVLLSPLWTGAGGFFAACVFIAVTTFTLTPLAVSACWPAALRSKLTRPALRIAWMMVASSTPDFTMAMIWELVSALGADGAGFAASCAALVRSCSSSL